VLPDASADAILAIDWLRPQFADDDGNVRLRIQALVVESAGRRMVVDTCLGNDKQGRSVPTWNALHGSFLRDLAAAGFQRESIDTVVCTHLHVDHVGWNTMLADGRWVPTFTNARYLMERTEFEYWRDQEAYTEQVAVFADSVQPVVEAGLHELVATDHRVCDEVSLVPTIGHTPGHVSVRIASQGAEALITGDFLHHPCQMAHPEWAATVDYDKGQSTRTRREVFGRLAGSETLLIGTHFAGATAGYVVRDGDAFRLVPAR